LGRIDEVLYLTRLVQYGKYSFNQL
jgi:hypothetical protein